MKLTPISNIRRNELKRAAFEVLKREGVQGTTLEKVALEAGCSKGIVLHYFATKRQLFEHTMRFANAALRDDVARRLRSAASPAERVWAIVETNFAPEFFNDSVCHAWLSLCAEVPWDERLSRIQQVIHARMRSNLVSALRSLLPTDEAEQVSLAVTTLIDGLWLRAGLQTGSMSRAAALDVVRSFLSLHIEGFLPKDHDVSEASKGK